MGSRFHRFLLAIFVALPLLYIIPTLVEHWIYVHTGPILAYAVVGNLFGCLLIALVNPRAAAALYFFLGAIEAAAAHLNLVSPSVLEWSSDLAPALVVCACIIWMDRIEALQDPRP